MYIDLMQFNVLIARTTRITPSGIWSAAVVVGDKLASEHFYRTVHRQYPSARNNPPAPVCLR
jgi:hypothetical protein